MISLMADKNGVRQQATGNGGRGRSISWQQHVAVPIAGRGADVTNRIPTELHDDAAFAIAQDGESENRTSQDPAPGEAGAVDVSDAAVPSRGHGPAVHATGRAAWFDRLNPFQEQRFARRVAREIVRLRDAIATANPALQGRSLLRLVVVMRCRVDPPAAEKLLLEAEESFAIWPTPRELTFGDVVHLIAFKEFHAEFGKTRWINANMGQIVAAELQRLR
jgi:hypothetical protein